MSDKVTRNLEKRVLSGDLEAVPALARAYERGGKPLSVWVFSIQTHGENGVYVFSSEEKAYEFIGNYLRNLLIDISPIENTDPDILLSLEAGDVPLALDIFQQWNIEGPGHYWLELNQTRLDPD